MKAEDFDEIVDRHLSQLSEHYDAVVILASSLRPDGSTARTFRRSGNYFAAVGMANDYLQSIEQEEQADAIAEKLQPEDSDD